MLKDEIFIGKPINEVWDFIVLEYAKSFKCSPSQVKNKQVETTAKTFNNKEVKITQHVSVFEVNKQIEVVSENSKDKVTTGYSLIEDPDGTFLATYEVGEGKQGFMRSWNYKLWSFPIFKNSSVKRLRQRLETIKGFVEGTINLEEDA